MDSNPRARCWGSEPDSSSIPFITAVFDGWSVAFLTPYDTHSDQTILTALPDGPSPSLTRFPIRSWRPALAVTPQLLCSGFSCHWLSQCYHWGGTHHLSKAYVKFWALSPNFPGDRGRGAGGTCGQSSSSREMWTQWVQEEFGNRTPLSGTAVTQGSGGWNMGQNQLSGPFSKDEADCWLGARKIRVKFPFFGFQGKSQTDTNLLVQSVLIASSLLPPLSSPEFFTLKNIYWMDEPLTHYVKQKNLDAKE